MRLVTRPSSTYYPKVTKKPWNWLDAFEAWLGFKRYERGFNYEATEALPDPIIIDFGDIPVKTFQSFGEIELDCWRFINVVVYEPAEGYGWRCHYEHLEWLPR